MFDRELAEWAKEWRRHADLGLVLLINDANADLYDGPDATTAVYPGFTTACKHIRSALHALPSTLYIDADSGCASEDEPSLDDGGEWYAVERSTLIRAIVGRELAEYVK